MSKQREITSTEKLLDVIRNRRGDASTPVPDQEGSATLKKRGLSRLHAPTIISLQKTPTIGIDIGHDHLRLVRASRSTGGHWQIEDRRRWDIPAHLAKDSPEFGEFLKTSLDAVIGSSTQVKLWSIMSAARVEVRNIRIPKLSKKQIANAVYWTLKKEAPFDEREMIFDFELQGEIIEQGIPKLAVMVYTAPRQEIESLKSIFARIGRPLTGISIVPFAVQNLFRTGWIDAREETIATLFLGNDFSRIDLYAHGNLVMTRGIKAGKSSMIEALVEAYNDSRKGMGVPSLTFEQGQKILVSLSPDSPPLIETDVGFGKEKGEIFEMIKPALERLVRQAERTFEHFSSTQQNEKITRMFVSGLMSVYQPIADYVGTQLGIVCNILDPLSENDAVPVCPDLDDSNCMSERISFAPAFGLALSDNDHTPNLIFTFKDKERQADIKRINQIVFSVFIAAVLGCAIIFSYQHNAISRKRSVIAGMEKQLAEVGPAVDRDQLMKMAAKVTQRRQLSRIYADRYLGMVLISELVALTPANVRFVDLKINLGQPPEAKTAKTTQEGAKGRTEDVTVDGFILGDRQMFETTLASYVMSLDASPLFRQVIIQKSSMEPFIKDEALHFIINLKVEDQVHG